MTEPIASPDLPAEFIARGTHRRDRLAVYGSVVKARHAGLRRYSGREGDSVSVVNADRTR